MDLDRIEIKELAKNKSDRRLIWAATRAVRESDHVKHKRSGKRSRSRWNWFERILRYLVVILKVIGYYKIGQQNVKDIRVKSFCLEFPFLPKSFDNYTILHLTDLHIDCMIGLDKVIIDKIRDLKYNLCVMTGDYRKSSYGSFKRIMLPMLRISSTIRAEHGSIAVLGNHDTYLMAQHEEEVGIRLLVNESLELYKGKDKIIVTGTDDPFYYYTDNAIYALEENYKGFKIALVHTSELSDVADKNGYSLYLCGHTHGGQVCLPGGKALLTHQFEGKHYVKGLWKRNNMYGYTSSGCGVSGVPLRFNCPGEVTLITLKRKS